MTYGELAMLDVGTVMEAGGLLPGITSEPVTFTIEAHDEASGTTQVVCAYFGVSVGHLMARQHKAAASSISWTNVMKDAAP